MPRPWTGRRILSIANLKGGVGKSTSAMMIADALSAHHAIRVLLIDLDPQANLSQMVLSFRGLKNAEGAAKTTTRWVQSLNATVVARGDEKPLALHSCVATGASGLTEVKEKNGRPGTEHGDLRMLPATPELRFAELDFDHSTYQSTDKLAPRRKMVRHLSEGLDSFANSIDLVIFDCPPGFSTLAQAALTLSDVIISPIQEEPSNLWSLQAFREFALKETLNIWSSERHRVLYTRVGGQGAQAEKINVKRDVQNAGFERLSALIKQTSNAHHWSVRAAPDSFRSFNSKYSSEKQRVRELGNEVVNLLIPLAPPNAIEGE